MKVSVAGLNHRTAPVEVREKFAFEQDRLGGLLEELRSEPGLKEGLILSTCNRVEIAVTSDDEIDTRQCLAHFLARARQVEPSWLDQFLYHYEQEHAIRHLFRVASSLDSMVLGEPQILGQMKEAWERARQAGVVSGMLDRVITSAFTAAKRVRTETEIGQSAVSISFAAVELAREIFGSLQGAKILLVGAGKMSELAARHLQRAGAGQILVTNRSPERARTLAELFGGSTVDYGTFQNALPGMDVVITSSGAPHYILTREQMRGVMESRRHRPVFLIDIAVPRNVEPTVNELDGVFLYDIDDLHRVVEQNRRARSAEANAAEQIITEEVTKTLDRLRAREAGPLIQQLQQSLEAVRAGEMERMRTKLGALTPAQQEAVDAVTRAIINKIAHGPISEIRRNGSAPVGDVALADLIRRLFRVSPD